MKKTLPILLAIPFLILFSCKDTIEEISSIGTFTSTITGDEAKQFDGTAAFTQFINTTTTPIGSNLVIGLSKVANQDELIALSLINEATSGIEVGTYDYSLTGADTNFTPIYTIDQTNIYSIPDLTKTNRITISSITDTQVKGEFELNLLNINSQAVKIVGTFNALGTTERE